MFIRIIILHFKTRIYQFIKKKVMYLIKKFNANLVSVFYTLVFFHFSILDIIFFVTFLFNYFDNRIKCNLQNVKFQYF